MPVISDATKPEVHEYHPPVQLETHRYDGLNSSNLACPGTVAVPQSTLGHIFHTSNANLQVTDSGSSM